MQLICRTNSEDGLPATIRCPNHALDKRSAKMSGEKRQKKFRSQEWFDNPDDPAMTALYIERYLNYGLTRAELQSGKPLIGIAQSGTSGSPSILNASPEAAVGGGLALLRTGDRVRIDLNKGTADILVPDTEIASRRAELQANGGFAYPKHQTPWQEIQRSMVDQLADGMVLKPAVKYQDVAHTSGVPRNNH